MMDGIDNFRSCLNNSQNGVRGRPRVKGCLWETLDCLGAARTAIAAVALAFLSAALLIAQTTTAGIRGTVSDSTQAAVVNAKVTVTNLRTQLTLTANTDSNGTYAFTLLPVGTYSLAVEVPGFKRFEQINI